MNSFIFSLNSQGNLVANGHCGSMLPAPLTSRAKREPCIPRCSVGGQGPSEAAGSGAFPTLPIHQDRSEQGQLHLLQLRTVAVLPNGCSELKKQIAQIPALALHRSTAVAAPMPPVPPSPSPLQQREQNWLTGHSCPATGSARGSPGRAHGMEMSLSPNDGKTTAVHWQRRELLAHRELFHISHSPSC